MNINTSTLLTMLSPKLTTGTKTTIENLSKDGKVDVTSLLKDKDVKALLSDLFKDLSTGVKTKAMISQLLQNNKPMFDLKTLSSDIKSILQNIQSEPKLEKQTAVLKQFQVDIKNLDEKAIKSNISNSGIFLESKLLNSSQNQTKMPVDIKAILLQVQEHLDTKGNEANKEVKVQVDKVLGQIEFYQLSSYTSNSNHTYLSFDWDDMDDSDIEFKSNEKETFSCNINLSLKNHGDINIMLLLDKKNNININMNVKEEDFKKKLQENLQILRQGVNNIGLSLESLNVLDIKDEDDKTYEEKAYSDKNGLSFGVDIKA